MPADYTIDGYLCAANATIDQVHPRADIILARRIPEAEITSSGLIVPEMARNKAMGVRVGEVLKCGPGDQIITLNTENYLKGTDTGMVAEVSFHPMECRPGDRILYMRCPDNDVNIGGVDCVFLREEQHVLAILGAE
jgi:co-chaperonin GroES (HSP10)